MHRITNNNKRRGKFTRELAETAMVDFERFARGRACKIIMPTAHALYFAAVLFVSQSIYIGYHCAGAPTGRREENRQNLQVHDAREI